ncbi:hypothetical protein P1X14_20175 [Sphingomonas sp. AOB5]|uniref:hypothetical protein n=1 Tax=Sphingomonas sp. AOB5 TaxID=3034017 RepID=UPI0023F8FED9|nr:hypothetical protein [Sphingomonas sp. AOB5]MDF7777584.1 hypothetical protein [Sphingomonas sp. AOB5]
MILRNFFACLALLLIAPLAAAQDAAPQDQPGLIVRAGESWIFSIKDGQPADPRKVADDAKPAKGELMVTLDIAGATVMTVANNDEGWWNYRAFIVVKPGHKGNRTSTCTLMNGGREAFEQWPEAIAAIRLADFTPAGDGDLRCG